MPRRPRLVVPGIPLHVTQRSVNRAATFLDVADREFYLALLDKMMRSAGRRSTRGRQRRRLAWKL